MVGVAAHVCAARWRTGSIYVFFGFIPGRFYFLFLLEFFRGYFDAHAAH